jgi:wyosine [tRNA(Phe)-imidazoG37] synthetase (radical SAM superfamily)
MKYLYGPVKSRRLGLSLGVSLTPYKTCSFDCVYCQLGKTERLTTQVKEYIPQKEILDELAGWLKGNKPAAEKLDYITFSGYGEPTLHAGLGELLTQIKQLTSLPVAVITNASLLKNPGVRSALMQADVVVPSLDAATPEAFQKIDRPHPSVTLEDVLQGLVSLRREFRGKIWLEVMLVKGLNDDLGHIRKLKALIDTIGPDKIQLNSPVRTPADMDVFPVDKKRLGEIREILGKKCEIV